MRRVALLGAAVVLAACGGHRAAAPGCRLTAAPTPVPETGRHFLAVRSSCAFRATPRVTLLGLQRRRLPFAYVQEGGPAGAHTLLLEKYRCDVRSTDAARTVELAGARLDVGRSLLDWCPAQAVSTVVHVYLGGLHPRGTRRGVLADARDGALERVWPCGALRRAVVPVPAGSPRAGLVGRAAAGACRTALAGLAPGAPRWAAVEALGAPTSAGARCDVWRWPPASGAVDCARMCFAGGRATVVQTAVHG